MQKIQRIIVMMLVGAVFTMQASVDKFVDIQNENIMPSNNGNSLKSGRKYIHKDPQSYNVELYTSDEADIIPLIHAVCSKYSHPIEPDILPSLIEASKKYGKIPKRSSKYPQAQEAGNAVRDVYSRILYVFEESKAQEEKIQSLKEEKQKKAQSVFQNARLKSEAGQVYKASYIASGQSNENLKKYRAKKREQEENNIEVSNNIVSGIQQDKKPRYDDREREVAGILVFDLRTQS